MSESAVNRYAFGEKYLIVNGRWHLSCAMTFKGNYNDTPVREGGSVFLTDEVKLL